MELKQLLEEEISRFQKRETAEDRFKGEVELGVASTPGFSLLYQERLQAHTKRCLRRDNARAMSELLEISTLTQASKALAYAFHQLRWLIYIICAQLGKCVDVCTCRAQSKPYIWIQQTYKDW
jgi:hypothetical protein